MVRSICQQDLRIRFSLVIHGYCLDSNLSITHKKEGESWFLLTKPLILLNVKRHPMLFRYLSRHIQKKWLRRNLLSFIGLYTWFYSDCFKPPLSSHYEYHMICFFFNFIHIFELSNNLFQIIFHTIHKLFPLYIFGIYILKWLLGPNEG